MTAIETPSAVSVQILIGEPFVWHRVPTRPPKTGGRYRISLSGWKSRGGTLPSGASVAIGTPVVEKDRVTLDRLLAAVSTGWQSVTGLSTPGFSVRRHARGIGQSRRIRRAKGATDGGLSQCRLSRPRD